MSPTVLWVLHWIKTCLGLLFFDFFNIRCFLQSLPFSFSQFILIIRCIVNFVNYALRWYLPHLTKCEFKLKIKVSFKLNPQFFLLWSILPNSNLQDSFHPTWSLDMKLYYLKRWKSIFTCLHNFNFYYISLCLNMYSDEVRKNWLLATNLWFLNPHQMT